MKEKIIKMGKWIWKHKLLMGAAVLILTGAVYFGYNKDSKGDEGDEIKTATVKKGDVSITVTGTGQVYAESQVDLKGVAAGDGIDVVQVAVQNDQEVKKDDLIVVLDTSDVGQKIRSAQLSVQSAEIGLRQTESQYDNQTKDDKYQRQAKEISLAQNKLNLNNAYEDLEDYYIRSPFDGIVTDLSVEVGDSVSQSDIIASVITKQMYAQISLNEVDAAKVKGGNKVTLTFDALPDLVIEGEVSKIDTIGKVVSNVVSYNAEISFDKASELLKPGMSVNAEIAIDSREGVLLVSNSAIKTNDDGSTYARVMSQGASLTDNDSQLRIVQQSVKTGLTDDVVVEIISGLEEGDVVITKMSSSASTKEEETGGLLDSIKLGPGTGKR